MKERPSGNWYYSVRPWESDDGEWYTEWVVSADSPKAAAQLVRNECEDPFDTFWVVPMTLPEDWTSVWDVQDERKYQAEAFSALWDEDECEKVCL